MSQIKPLDDFETECIVTMLANYATITDDLTGAEERRMRSRLRRFVLTHPQVDAKLATLYRSVVRRGGHPISDD